VQRASGEGSFTGDPGRYVKKGSGYGHLSIGAPLGNLEGSRLPGLLRESIAYLGSFLGPRGH